MSYFKDLNYSLGDEDPSVELAALPEHVTHLACIAGSGSRLLPLLSKAPKLVTCVDVSREQLALTELRVESLRQMELSDFKRFLGYDEGDFTPARRLALFRDLRISDESRRLLEPIFTRNRWRAIIYFGRFEKMLRKLSRVFRLIIGAKLERLFDTSTLEEQRAFCASKDFPRMRWNTALFVLGNATLLNAILYRGEFPKKNLPGSEYENYRRIFGSLQQNVYCRDSFFLQMVAFGRLRHPDNCSREIAPLLFRRAKEALSSTQIEYVCGDVLDTVRSSRTGVEFLSLSDVPSFFDDARAGTFLDELRDHLTDGGRVAFRGHLRMAKPSARGYRDCTEQFLDVVHTESTQLWQVRLFEKA
jgi:S-adenosylmethionine-diacylglycerol 3-amino-3-carboxypropyl transferase